MLAILSIIFPSLFIVFFFYFKLFSFFLFFDFFIFICSNSFSSYFLSLHFFFFCVLIVFPSVYYLLFFSSIFLCLSYSFQFSFFIFRILSLPSNFLLFIQTFLFFFSFFLFHTPQPHAVNQSTLCRNQCTIFFFFFTSRHIMQASVAKRPSHPRGFRVKKKKKKREREINFPISKWIVNPLKISRPSLIIVSKIRGRVPNSLIIHHSTRSVSIPSAPVKDFCTPSTPISDLISNLILLVSFSPPFFLYVSFDYFFPSPYLRSFSFTESLLFRSFNELYSFTYLVFVYFFLS